MNRALPLLLIAAVAAGGLGYLVYQSGHDPLSTGEDLSVPDAATYTAVDPSTAEPVQLTVPTQAAPRPKRRDTDGIAKSLEIIPMNALGQLLADAQVVAVQGDEELTGTGRVKWDSVPAGDWTLTVEAADAPKWVRTLTLRNGERRREAAYVCEELRIQGEVMDAYGVASAKTQLFFLPAGVRHPSLADLVTEKRGTAPIGKWETSTGAIPATTGASGSFSVRLPNPGKWRVSVGFPDKPSWTQSKPTELTVGGADNVRVVTPAKSRLTMTLSTQENRPSQVSAYTFDLAYANRLQRQEMERNAASGKDANIQKEQKGLARKARREQEKSGGKTGKSDSDGGKAGDNRKRAMEENARLSRERRGGGIDHRPITRSPIFEPGWRPVSTARFDDLGVAVLDNLPGRENIRFLFVRGRERITTANSTRLEPAVRSLATVDLPSPLPESEEAPRSNAASVRVQLDSESEAAKLEESVEWTVD